MPDLINCYPVDTPVADRLRASYPHLSSPDAGPIAIRLGDRLGAWEMLVVRLREGWPPDGWFPAVRYREILGVRDELAVLVDDLPVGPAAEVGQALAEMDRLFAEATVEDGGRALAAATGELAVRHWWWRRVSDPLPWRDEPGQAGR